MTRRQQNLQALRWRLALHPEALSEFLGSLFFKSYAGERGPVDTKTARLTD
jgi:hypothetical protein